MSAAIPSGARSGEVRGPSDRLARHDDQPGIERVDVDRDRVEALVDRERHGLAVVLERPPRPSGPGLEPDPAEDERPVIGVLELVLGVDPAGDPDVRPVAARGDLVAPPRP